MSIKSWQPRQVKLSYVRSKNQFSNFLIYKEVCWNFHSPMLSCSSVCLKLHHSVKDSQKMLHRLCTNVPYRKITFLSVLSCSPWSRHSSWANTLAARSSKCWPKQRSKGGVPQTVDLLGSDHGQLQWTSLLKAAGQRDFKSFTHLISCGALVTLNVIVWLLPEPWHLLKVAVTLPIGLVEGVCWNVRGLSK